MKHLILSMVSVVIAAMTSAATITVTNFDEDLATVYVNDVATTNGQQIAVAGEVKIELKDFRNDYYFRYAPMSQTDRTLGFESWDGLPEGAQNLNPTTFTLSEDVTITPNVDVKGYAWTFTTYGGNNVISNHYHIWKSKTFSENVRGVTLNNHVTNTVGATKNNLEIDFVERVKYNGKNYTITGIPDSWRPAEYHTRAGLWSFSPRFATFGPFISSGHSTTSITNLVGVYDLKTATIGQYCFYYGDTPIGGPATNCVPRKATRIDNNAYQNKGMTGELLLETVTTIGGSAFSSCGNLTAARLVSPALTSIAGSSFASCNKMKEVTIGSSVLTSAGIYCFPTSVTNFIFTGEAPSSAVLDNMLYSFSSADGAHSTRFTVDPSRSNWWHRVSTPTENEIAAGLPPNCMGSYVTANGRKAWIVSGSPTSGILVIGDMAHQENLGCTTVTGLALNQELTLIAPSGMTIAFLQHLVNGVWATFEEKDLNGATSFVYRHSGELTRVQWRTDGVVLTLTQSGYAGTLSIKVKSGSLLAGDNIYSNGSELWITAIPQTTSHPYTKFAKWTIDGEKSAETNTVLMLTLNEDTSVDCLFGAAEWLYNESTKKATDGFWTTGARSGDIENYGMTFGSFTSTDYTQWLDFSIPVYVPSDPAHQYWIMKVTGPNRDFTARRVRFGAGMIVSGLGFWSDVYITEIEGLGKTKTTYLGDYFLYNYGAATPLRSQTYECTDFVPETLTGFGAIAFAESPNLVGTLRFSVNNINDLKGLRISAITNFEFLSESLTTVDTSYYRNHQNVQNITFGSTNLTSVTWYTFEKPSNEPWPVRSLTFLAHAPTVAALNNILYSATTTNTVIYCSRSAPGWKAMRMKDGYAQPEWAARTEGTWGLYKTQNGKLFYLVQRDSKYDSRNGLAIILR
jgi:hypothetical protein